MPSNDHSAALDPLPPMSASENGSWRVWAWRPDPRLEPYVTRLEGFEERGGAPVLRTELPSCTVPLVIVLDHGFTLHEGRDVDLFRRLDRPFIAGVHTIPSIVGSPGAAACAQVDLTPLGARRLLRTEMVDLHNTVADLADFAPAATAALVQELRDLDRWDARFRALERFLCQRLLRDEPDDPRVVEACRLLETGERAVRIGELATRLDVSRKHLNSLFHRQIGCSPKVFMRIARFSRAVTALQDPAAAPFASFADLAAWCGYADQSHFNRDFRAFAGASPRDLAGRILPDAAGIEAGRR